MKSSLKGSSLYFNHKPHEGAQMSLKTETCLLVCSHFSNANILVVSPLWMCENMADFSQTKDVQPGWKTLSVFSYYVFLKQQFLHIHLSQSRLWDEWLDRLSRGLESTERKDITNCRKTILYCLTFSVTLCKTLSSCFQHIQRTHCSFSGVKTRWMDCND